jgi:hypothetical protein
MVSAGTTGTVLSNNIVVASSHVCISVPAGILGLSSDYNGFFREGSASLALVGSSPYFNLVAWQGTPYDAHSLEADPLFVSNADLHLQSTAGHFTSAGWVADLDTSPFLDRGDPAAPFDAEPTPNGGRLDLGAFGDTAEASLIPVTLTLEGGDDQTGPPQSSLAQPFQVLVAYTTSGAPAPGVTVQFSPTTAGASMAPAAVATDSSGIALSTATLGPPGRNTFNATLPQVAGAGVVTFSAVALGGPSLLRVGCSCGSSVPGQGSLFLLWMLPVVALLRRFRRPPKRPTFDGFSPPL